MVNGRKRISRRRFCQNSLAAIAAAEMPFAGSTGTLFGREPLKGKPNILFIFSDQQRWDSVECYGSPLFKGLTPNLDKLADEGVRFEHAFTCQPVCGPTRAVLQTGKYATEIGCFRNNIALPENETTLAHRLSNAGYEVGYLGKWHLASSSGGPEKNFHTRPVPPRLRGGYKDFWLASDVLEFTSHGYGGHMFDDKGQKREYDQSRYRVDAQTDWALEYLRRQKNDKPFFLFLSYIEPHHQNDRNHFEGPHGSKERFKDYAVPGDLQGTKGDWREEMPDYLGCINSLDRNVGRIRDELEKLGLAQNTLIVYTSDHGCHFCTRNGEYKRSCHESSIRIPLIVHGPGFRGGKTVKKLVNLLDVHATVLAAGQVQLPASCRGRALQELVSGKVDDWPEDTFVQISESQVGRALRTHKWKYAVRAPGKNGARDSHSDLYVEDFLYDLENDPHERQNLVSDPAFNNLRAELAQRLIKRMIKIGEQRPIIKGAVLAFSGLYIDGLLCSAYSSGYYGGY